MRSDRPARQRDGVPDEIWISNTQIGLKNIAKLSELREGVASIAAQAAATSRCADHESQIFSDK